VELIAPDLPYQPPAPRAYRPRIGLIGCGGITRHHLEAYREAGWEVAAFCDVDEERAHQRRDEFQPLAPVFTEAAQLLATAEVDVVDIALHPEHRAPVVAAALRAGKHVLSQKPFVTDLVTGRELVALARERGLKLAVNQNGRWAPYVSYARAALAAGLLGELQTVNLRINWDHTWCRGTPFEAVPHLILFDFGIHWFDMVAQFFKDRPAGPVTAHVARAPGQEMKPPMLAQAMIPFPDGLATLAFDGHSRFGAAESLVLTGTRGTLRSQGPVVESGMVELTTAAGTARARLQGRWFNDGFRGAMGELLCAIEENREPANSGADNLRTVALCLAACRAADTGQAQVPEGQPA
jgi:predicted dehydrogenase